MDKESFPVAAIGSAASIIRIFVEDYHEKQEENYLFPRFKKANQLTVLVDTLLQQHNAGYLPSIRQDSPDARWIEAVAPANGYLPG